MIKNFKLFLSDNSNDLRKPYSNFIIDNGPYSYLITLTFRKRLSEDDCIRHINFLFFLLNRKIFRSKNGDDFLNGFCFFEKHGQYANNDLHCHIIIKHNELLDIESKKPFVEHFWSCLKKVKILTDKNSQLETDLLPNAFDESCCKIDTIYEISNLIKYLTKRFEKESDASWIKPINGFGI